MHMATNSCSFLLLRLESAYPEAAKSGGILDSAGGASAGSLAIIAVALAVLAGSVLWLRRDFDNHPLTVLEPVSASDVPADLTSPAPVDVVLAPLAETFDNSI